MNATVIATTYLPPGPRGKARSAVSIKCLTSVADGLRLEGKPLPMLVADDGSDPTLIPWDRSNVVTTNRLGVGGAINNAMWGLWQDDPDQAVVVVPDDLHLNHTLELAPYLDLLHEYGMVYLGFGYPQVQARIEQPTVFGTVCARLERNRLSFTLRPAIFTRVFIEAYGPLPEGVSAWACEAEYGDRFATMPGPDIAVAWQQPWEHFGSEWGDSQAGAMTPAQLDEWAGA